MKSDMLLISVAGALSFISLRGWKVRPVRALKRPRRNQKCFCGSGEKYKHCCLKEKIK